MDVWEEKRMKEKRLMTAPTAKLETPNDLAKSGMAGMMTPYPIATEKETAVRTATSLGRPSKGFFTVASDLTLFSQPRGPHLISAESL